MRHIISVVIENETGALSRVSGLFSQRCFNIESLKQKDRTVFVDVITDPN